jgi:hypothetical protein
VPTATAPKRKPAAPKPSRRILIYMDNGERVLVENIPANAKVTFSKVNPAGPGFNSIPNAVRIYTVESNQLAVFTGVRSFRDLSLTVKEQTAQRKLRENAVTGPNGGYSDSQYETEYTWEEVALDSPPDIALSTKMPRNTLVDAF